LVQTHLRTRSCHRTRTVPQGRSASVRVSRLWTRGVKTAQTGQGTTCWVEVTRRISSVAAAVANAVFHATGIRVRDLPITLDKLL
jgi:hypothetical protein